MPFNCPKCGGDQFEVGFKENLYGIALLDEYGDILDTYDESGDDFIHQGKYKCIECDTEFDDISNTDPEEVWIKKKKKLYIASGGLNCPICDSSEIEGGHIEADSHGAWQECSCAECDAVWRDVHKLVGVEIESYPTDYMLQDIYPKGQKPDPNKAFKKEK